MSNLKLIIKNHYYQYLAKIIIFPFFLILIFSIDWTTKYYALHNLISGYKTDFIENFLSLKLEINYGLAYGSYSEDAILPILLSIIANCVFIIIMIFINNKFLITAISIILGGSMANIFGRSWGPNGGVIDLFTFEFTFSKLPFLTNYVFNFADFSITIGGFLVVLYFLYEFISFIYLILIIKKRDLLRYQKIIDFKDEKKIILQQFEFKTWKIFFSKENKKITKFKKLKADVKEAIENLKQKNNLSDKKTGDIIK